MNKEIEVCDFRYDEGLRSRVDKQIIPCITCHSGGGYSGTPMVMEKEKDLKIRKLTSLECWRLMGFSDQDHFNAKQVNSETQLYKQAGNSIVVNVLMAIFKELLDGQD